MSGILVTPVTSKRNRLSLSKQKSAQVKQEPTEHLLPTNEDNSGNGTIRVKNFSQLFDVNPANQLEENLDNYRTPDKVDEPFEELDVKDVCGTNESAFLAKDDEIISLSSDEESFEDEKKPKNVRKRKRTKAQTTIRKKPEKIEIKRTIPKSAKVKDINAKLLPESQTRIKSFFKPLVPSNSIKYFETFDKSKQDPAINANPTNPLEILAAKIDRIQKQRPPPVHKIVDAIDLENDVPSTTGTSEKLTQESNKTTSSSISNYFSSKRKKQKQTTKDKRGMLKDNKVQLNNGSCENTVSTTKSLSPMRTRSFAKRLIDEQTLHGKNTEPVKNQRLSKKTTTNKIKRRRLNSLGTESMSSKRPNGSSTVSKEAPDDSNFVGFVDVGQKPIKVRRKLTFKTTEIATSNDLKDARIPEGEAESIISIDLTDDLTPPEGQVIPKPVKTVWQTPQPGPSGISAKRTNPTGKRTKRNIECPAYKVIEGTTFAVDAFRFGEIEGITHYFLSHFHADHYIGLKKSFSKTIFLSRITARLVKEFIKVNDIYLHQVDIDVPFVIEGIEITAMEANHCPGAVMFLFKFPNGVCTLHTGDFRASPEMEEHPIFWNNSINTIYLDTTYLSSKYAFKSQSDSILDVIAAIEDFKIKHIGAKILYVCGSYVIGKEKVWTKIAKENKLRVWTDGNRKKALKTIADVNTLKYLIDDPTEAQLHILNIGNLSYDYLLEYLKQYSDYFDILLAIRPTGWEKNSKPQYRGRVNIIGIEYSEHSSYEELRRFVRYLQPHKIISTVPCGNDLAKTGKIPDDWLYNEIRSRTKGYQTSITNYVHISGSVKSRLSNVKMIDEIEQAKMINSCEDLGMLDLSCENNNNLVDPSRLSDKISKADTDWMS